jgi:hypothetical protein
VWLAGQEGLAGKTAISYPTCPTCPTCLTYPDLPDYFFVDETGAGSGLSTYSLRNHALAPFRVIFTCTCRRRFDASGFDE